jgi:hypothetical protein
MALKHKSISKAVMEAGVIRRPAQDLAPEQAEALLRRLHPDWPEGAVARIVRLVQRGGIQ